MKIVHVCRQYHPGVGGLESFTRNLCEQQAKAGHQVRMITLDRIFDGDGSALLPHEEIGGVEVIRVPFRGGRRYPLAPAILRHIDESDIVHVHAVDFFVDFLAATHMLHGKPMVLSTHGGFFHTPYAQRLKRAYFNSISRLSLSRFKAVIACSHADHETFARICSRSLTLVENGVDVDKFAGLAQPDARTIIYFGRIAPNKRVDRLIRWFAGLHKLDPSWSLIVAGKPMGVTLADLQAVIDEEGLGGSVELHESPSDEALRSLIARSSIFASASAYEGFGISFIEAVSAGLYPVISDIPAHRRSWEKLGIGSLIDFTGPFSPARILQDFRAARSRNALASAQQALGSYGWPQVAERILHIYEQLLGHRSRRIGTINVAVRSRDEALEEVTALIHQRAPVVIAFCNAHTANLGRRDPQLAASLEKALVLNDGIGVNLASRLRYGRAFPENLNGTDFIPKLMDAYADRLRLFLVGAAPGIGVRAASTLERGFPNVKVVGVQHGFFDPAEEAAIAQRIAESEADLVIACMGNPRQEIWAARWAAEFQRPVVCGGAFLDFAAGQIRRAPAWLRQMRLEWVYRLLKEPTRLSERYLKGNIDFMAHAIRDAWEGQRWEDSAPPTSPLRAKGASAA
ncbi:WecB/TagA/CpsF family glycosyltransferase [Sphingobium bisphenolivorans]|uniref:WecB/TagA/CpsF family glycosyltransferase n=1 Tax=Sphingobium bisphenolivorans TaxID=1335760 RepID=UPI0003A7A3BA|nr:WecB/TagA/CpsF family glycosyltransferase [Sphingobium bisphenolivorans]